MPHFKLAEIFLNFIVTLVFNDSCWLPFYKDDVDIVVHRRKNITDTFLENKI